MFQGGSRGKFFSNRLVVSFRLTKAGLPYRPVAMAVAGILAAGVLAATLVASILHPAAAQANAGDVQVLIAPVVRVPAAAESPLRIEVTSRTGVPNRSIILIKGLPSAISLSQGRLFESGTWAVPITNLGDLRMISGSGPVKSTDFSVSVVTVSGDVLAESASSLVVVPQGQPIEATAAVQQADRVPPSREDTNPATNPVLPIVPPQLSGKALDMIMLFMAKGDNSLQSGNINMARMFYTQAAEQGWAEAASSLATTYDPVELAQMRVAGGIKPEPETARKWYETAIRLGSKSAEARLQRLTGR